MIDAQLIEVVGGASTGGNIDEAADRTSQRILDAALQEAAAVGLQRITVEDVVRRAGVSRMTAYRRYPRRDDLVESLVRRETQRFLGAVADAIDSVEMGSGFIANYIHGDAPGAPSQKMRWVADVFARLFFTYISMPPIDPDFADDSELRRFAHEVLTPMVERVV